MFWNCITLIPFTIKTIYVIIALTIAFILAIAYFSPRANGSVVNQLSIEFSPYVESTHPQFISPTPTSTKTPKTFTLAVRTQDTSKASNIALGQQIALASGYDDQDWQCLYTLGMRESGWSHTATNKTSGAFGIPQSLPASKLDTLGNRYDPAVQIKWFIQYVETRYQGSCNALKHSLALNWY